MKITIARADGDRVRTDTIELPPEATIGDALRQAVDSGLVGADCLDAVKRGDLGVAVFARPATLEQQLRPDDRIELLGPLTVDPKIARQRRVAHRRATLERDKWSRAGR